MMCVEVYLLPAPTGATDPGTTKRTVQVPTDADENRLFDAISKYKLTMKRVLTTAYFDDWFCNLNDRAGARRIQARIDRAAGGNFGDCAAVGEGVSEMRIDFGPGYRVYFVQRGSEIVILLAGGDKSSQASDVKFALELARQV